MNNYDEVFVGALAIFVAAVAIAVALGPWKSPYQLRSCAAIVRRFGKPAARGLWFAIAIALMSAGVAIISFVIMIFSLFQPDRKT